MRRIARKARKIQNLSFELEVRDITTREDWFAAYEYEVPVLYLSNYRGAEGTEEEIIEAPLPRPSPRASVQQLEQMLRKYLAN